MKFILDKVSGDYSSSFFNYSLFQWMISLIYSDRSCICNTLGLASKKLMGRNNTESCWRDTDKRDRRSKLKIFSDQESLKMLGFASKVSDLKDNESKRAKLS